ncbi:TPA: hypothetical protein DDW35_13280 [Candidatus Sumerlaeota bacterium]|jgi:endonuclease/exonuclease/phosphatase family metal-dependent hydrolase|nr:hypothetical protein [Candidatus Sumerlaeota bacterium]
MYSSIQRFVRVTVLSALLSLPFLANAEPLPNSPFEKTTSTQQVRVLTYNVNCNYLQETSADAALERILHAVQPDVIAFQELPESAASNNPEALARLLEKKMKVIQPNTKWNAWVGKTDGISRNAIVSRYPLSMTIRETTPPSNEVRGVNAALVQLPSQAFDNTSLYLMNVNFKVGTSEGPQGDFARRQRHADAVANWILDSTTPAKMGRPAGDKINLKARTPILIVGDYHFTDADREGKGPYHPARTLLRGEILDKKTYGEGRLPDWDGSTLSTVRPTPLSRTSESFMQTPGLAAHFIYTDSVFSPVRCVQVDSTLLSSTQLKQTKLQQNDTTEVSKYLPTFADFVLGTSMPTAAPKVEDAPQKEGHSPSIPRNPLIFHDTDTETGPTLPTVNP